MIGLALEGGGVKGSYQAGVYLAFLECNIHIDGVCGTSIGAINGALIASGAGGDIADIWLNMDFSEVFGIDNKVVNSINKSNKSIEDIKNVASGIKSIIKNKGLSFNGLRRLLEENINPNKLKNSAMDFGLVTVRFHDLKPLYLWKETIPEDKLIEAILASSYLPIFKFEKIIDDNYYLDGGFYDNNPVNMLINKGYEKIYLVKIQGIGIFKKYDEKKVVVIESKRNLGHVIEFNQSQIEENIMMGYYDGIRVLKKLDGEKYVFKREKGKYYKRINKKVNKELYRRVKAFFNGNSYKENVILATEYIMEKENINYYQIYNIKKIIKKLKKIPNTHFVYTYIKSLKLF